MAAVTAKGTTVLENCAREPEILELCMFLIKMGAVIRNVGGRTLVIEGKERLFPCEYELGADRICGGTYLAAAVIAGGEIAVSGVWPEALREPLRGMERMGARVSVDERNREIRLAMSERPRPVMLATGPYPDFPTDLQSPFLAAASVAAGVSRIEENVFDARFKTAGELRKLGAKIHIRGRTAHVTGNWPLMPALVESPDLRGGAALVLAALAADGESLVGGCEHIARGYEDIVRDLCELGAEVSWV